MTEYDEHKDWDLVQECLRNNRQAQEALYHRFAYMMKGICLRYARSEMEAEDVLQDAFVQAFRSLGAYTGEGALGAWLRKVTVNKALEHYRRNRKLTELKAFLEWGESSSQISDSVIDKLAAEDLIEKIRQLPVGFRTVFNLYTVEGYNHREIAELLEISEGTSKSQYSRARMMLRKMIEKEQLTEQQRLGYAR